MTQDKDKAVMIRAILIANSLWVTDYLGEKAVKVILTQIKKLEQEAYKKGFIDGGLSK